MEAKPLDLLRQAHRTAERKLDALEKSAKLLGEKGNATAWGTLDEVCSFFDGELRVHFRHEEEVLFPYLVPLIGRQGPIAVMLDEHQVLWRTLDALREKADSLRQKPAEPAKLKTLQGIANHIVGLLRSHIVKEDSVLFPLAERSLDSQTLQEVVDRIATFEAADL